MARLATGALKLRRQLKDAGLSDPAIEAAWPTWWSDDADASPSAVTELRFSLSRKLGLDPRTLLTSSEEPRFIWRDETRFKHMTGKSEAELDAISSFGTALGSMLINATVEPFKETSYSALQLREMLLNNVPVIGLRELLTLAWSLGIPVIHLRVFPCERKRMAAMASRSGARTAVMMARDSDFPAGSAFYLAHEIGHILLGHLASDAIWLDVDVEARQANDKFESEADSFALELLTGNKRPTVLPTASRYTAKQVAESVSEASMRYRIEPGVLAMCFGYSTRRWHTANAALQFIYPEKQPVWIGINDIARAQLDLGRLSDDNQSYVDAILGSRRIAS